MIMGTNSTMNPKRHRFVEEYLVDLNATQAAKRAGYSVKTAHVQGQRLLNNAEIKAEVAKAMAARQKRTQIDQDYVLHAIVDTLERCRQVRPVLDRKGDQVMVETPDGEMAAAFTFDATNALKGADMLAKHIGLYEKDNEQGGGAIAKLLREVAGSAGILDAARERSR